MADGMRIYPRDPAHEVSGLPLDYDAPTFRTIRIGVSAAFTNRIIQLEGRFLWASRASNPGVALRVQINAFEGDGVIFSEGVRVTGVPFSQIIVTNPDAWGAEDWIELTACAFPVDVSSRVADDASEIIDTLTGLWQVKLADGDVTIFDTTTTALAVRVVEYWVQAAPTNSGIIGLEIGSLATSQLLLSPGDWLMIPFRPRKLVINTTEVGDQNLAVAVHYRGSF